MPVFVRHVFYSSAEAQQRGCLREALSEQLQKTDVDAPNPVIK